MVRTALVFRLGLLALIGSLALGGQANAQDFRGRVTGVVKDASGGILPGVTVTATSPALIQPQSDVSSDDGTYRLIALPAGVYELTFELSGFRTLKRDSVRVLINTTLTVNADLEVATVQETVTVSGASPVIDTTSTGVGTNFTNELLTEIPGARDVWATMAQAPGFQMTGYDVGGSHAGTQTGFITYGLAEQRTTRIEGINTTEGTDANAGYFDYGSFEEFQLGGAGNGADQDTPGASLNIQVKSGGDKFSGTWYSDWQGKGLISDNVPDAFKQARGVVGDYKAPNTPDGVLRGNQVDRQYDINGNVGGPVYRRKAWFFGSYRLNNQYSFITGSSELAQSKLTNYTVKGTYQLNQNNQLIGYWNQREKLQPLRDLGPTRPVSTASYQASRNYPFKGEWTSVLNDRMFLDVIVADWRNYFPLRPTAEFGLFPADQFVAGRLERTTGTYFDGGANGPLDTATTGGVYQDQKRKKPQYLVTLNYFKAGWIGTHDVKFGAEGRWEERVFFQDQPFNIFYRDRNGIPEAVDLFNTPTAGDNRTNAHSFFAQDTWRLSQRLTLNLGLRLDRYRDFFPDQSIDPEGYAPLRNSTNADVQRLYAPRQISETEVAKSFTAAPRIGFAYDLGGNGKSVIKGFFGQFYYNSAPDTLGALENPNGTGRFQFQFNDLNGNKILDSDAELGRLLNTFGGAGFVSIDRDLKRPYSQEASTHFEQEIVEGLSARGSYVYKNMRNKWDEVDLLRVGAYTIARTFNDVGADNMAGTADDQVLQIFDRQAGIGSERVFTNPDGDDGDYHTVEVALNRRFRNNWMLLTSFGYTWLDQWHDIASSTSALTAGGPSENFLWRPNQQPFGRETTAIWNYKLIGRYEFPLQVGVSSSYKIQSGRQYGRTASVPASVLTNAGAETIFVESVTARRFPNVHIFDVRFDKSFSLSRYGTITALMDVFNLFNSDPVTNARVTSGASFNEVIALLDPRVVRFGVRFEF